MHIVPSKTLGKQN